MPEAISAAFVSYAAEVIADTEKGITGPQIVRLTTGYAIRLGIDLPHFRYPFDAPNKRTALFENLMRLPDVELYRIIKDLCEDEDLIKANGIKISKLKMKLIMKYGYLAHEAIESDLDKELINKTKHWLGNFPEALSVYIEALEKYTNHIYTRNVLDDMRLSLELLLKNIFNNDKSTENQISTLGQFIKDKNGSVELSNMFVKLIDYYAKYQNSYVKHDSAVIEDEVEFVIEITSVFMKHVIRLSYR